MKNLKIVVMSACYIFSSLVFADVTPSTSAIPNNFKVTGYLDGSYNYLQQSNKFISGSNNRYFDLAQNGLTLQQAAITMAYQPEKGFGALLNLIAGRDVNTFASYGFRPSTEFDSQTFAIDFPQAFLQYVKGPVTIIGGRFLTLVGVEQVDPTLNTNFSRGILFYNTSDTHTGVRGTYVVNDKLNLILGINDGWDNIRDWKRGQTVEFGLSYTVNPKVSFSAQGYSGKERATPQTDFGPKGTRTLFDLIGTYNATEKLALIANYDYGWQTQAALPTGAISRAAWMGLAGYANYKFNDKWRTSLRGEVFRDEDGFRTGVVQNWKEVTITVGYTPIKNLELRGETRRDFSNVNSFLARNGVSAHDFQQSYALEGVYKFE